MRDDADPAERPLARIAAAITAIVALVGLVLQLVLLVGEMTADGASVAEALWRFVGFFTILTNAAVALVAAALALAPASRLAGPRARLTAAASILFVGLVYTLALRWSWNPTGWKAVADHIVHDATPLLFLATWFAASHGTLRRSDALRAPIAPIGYCLYAMARGAFDGWYAYWFLDPSSLGAVELIASMAVLGTAFLGLAMLLVAVDRGLARPSRSVDIGERPV